MVVRTFFSVMLIAACSLRAMEPDTVTPSSSLSSSNVPLEDIPYLITSIDGFSALKKNAIRIVKNQIFSSKKRLEVKMDDAIRTANSVKFNRDGSTLAVDCAGIIRILDAKSGAMIREIRWPTMWSWKTYTLDGDNILALHEDKYGPSKSIINIVRGTSIDENVSASIPLLRVAAPLFDTVGLSTFCCEILMDRAKCKSKTISSFAEIPTDGKILLGTQHKKNVFVGSKDCYEAIGNFLSKGEHDNAKEAIEKIKITLPFTIESIMSTYDGAQWGVLSEEEFCRRKVYLYDAATNQQTHCIALSQFARSVALNREGTYLVERKRSVARIIDVATGKTVHTITLPDWKEITSIAFNPDSTQLAMVVFAAGFATLQDPEVCIFDLHKNAPKAVHRLNRVVHDFTLKEYELLQALNQAMLDTGRIYPSDEQLKTWKLLREKLPAKVAKRFTLYVYDAQEEYRKALDEHFSGLNESCAMQ